jgi:hypothetical protein
MSMMMLRAMDTNGVQTGDAGLNGSQARYL